MISINLPLLSYIFNPSSHRYLNKMTADPRSAYLSVPQQQAFFLLLVGPDEEELIEASTTLSRIPLLEKAKCATITVEQDEVEIVSAYLYYYRTGSIPCTPPLPKQKQPPPHEKPKLSQKERDKKEEKAAAQVHALEYERLTKLFLFRNRHRDIQFKNSVVDAIFSKAHEKDAKGRRWPPTHKAVTSIFEATHSNAPIRKMLVDIIQDCDEDALRRMTFDGNTTPFSLEVVAKLQGQVDAYQKELQKQPATPPSVETYHEAEAYMP